MTAKEMFEKLGYMKFDMKYNHGDWYQLDIDGLRRKNIKIYKDDKEVCIYGDMFPKQEIVRSNAFPTTLDISFPVTLDKDEIKALCKRLKELGVVR